MGYFDDNSEMCGAESSGSVIWTCGEEEWEEEGGRRLNRPGVTFFKLFFTD